VAPIGIRVFRLRRLEYDAERPGRHDAGNAGNQARRLKDTRISRGVGPAIGRLLSAFQIIFI